MLLLHTPQGCRRYSPDTDSFAEEAQPAGYECQGYAVAHGELQSSAEFKKSRKDQIDASEPSPLEMPDGGLLTQLRWSGGALEIVTDHAGAYPIYFAQTTGGLVLGDDAWEVARAAGLRNLDDGACLDLICYEMVLGRRTLIAGLEQAAIGARTVWRWEDNITRRDETTLWRLTRPASCRLNLNGRLDAAAENLRELCRPILNAAASGAKPLALNLSGGWDSRALLACLAPLGPERLIACTYGPKDFNGTRRAREAAAAAGIPARWARLDSGSFLREWFGDLCRQLPPVVRFTLGDGAHAMGAGFYAEAQSAVVGHSGDGWTKATTKSPVQSETEMAQWLRTTMRPGLLPGGLRALLHAEHRALADGVEDRVGAMAKATFAPNYEGPMRWLLEQRVRRLVCPELRVLERYAKPIYAPMLDRRFIDFWGQMPDADLVSQSLYRQMLARRLFVDKLAPLATIPREGGGTLLEPLTSLGRLRAEARRYALAAARRLNPAWTYAHTVPDPNVAWWIREPEFRAWAWETIRKSEKIYQLFDGKMLETLVRRTSLRQFRIARSVIWTLLTIAGVEATLRIGELP